jgi:FkbM family methyltransferase
MNKLIVTLAEFAMFILIRVYILFKQGDYNKIEIRYGTTDLFTFWMIFICKEYKLPKTIIKKPTFIIDAGANIGLASLYYQFQYPNIPICAIELENSNIEILKANFAPYKNICVIDKALWYENTILEIKLPEESRKKDSFSVSQNSLSRDSKKIETITPQEVLLNAKNNDIVLFKIDIEGAELELFSHNVENWINSISIFVIETHERFKSNSKYKVLEVLQQYNFDVIKNEGYHIIAVKQ